MRAKCPLSLSLLLLQKFNKRLNVTPTDITICLCSWLWVCLLLNFFFFFHFVKHTIHNGNTQYNEPTVKYQFWLALKIARCNGKCVCAPFFMMILFHCSISIHVVVKKLFVRSFTTQQYLHQQWSKVLFLVPFQHSNASNTTKYICRQSQFLAIEISTWKTMTNRNRQTHHSLTHSLTQCSYFDFICYVRMKSATYSITVY